MQAQCDACRRIAASVFCNTEELVFCGACDHQVHQDNPNHHRISFFYPVPKHISICDACQETKAFMFCREHRAILCRTCDTSMHSTDEFMKKHSRFLLTGAKLCTGGGDGDRGSTSTGQKHGAGDQLDVESGGSTSSSVQEQLMEMTQAGVDMSADDPYGLCKQKGEGSRSAFEDTDLGCFLSSLSPKKP